MSNCLALPARSPLDISHNKVDMLSPAGKIRPNNTPQAYLPKHRHDAQTGGLLISGVGNAL